jgi:hypothetical protein
MNSISNYLAFCKKHSQGHFLFVYEDITTSNRVIKKGSEIKIVSYKEAEDRIQIEGIDKSSNPIFFEIKWFEEVPFTHFNNGEQAYKHARFTNIPLGTKLENYIFSRSPKYASMYAIEVAGKRLSASLEDRIFRNYRYITSYASEFDIKLSEEQESAFLNDPTGDFVACYGIEKIKGKLPETLHNYLIMKFAESKRYWVEKYFNSLKE